ncbi:MAG: hypothetical protein Q9212_001915 [Teloschistes hypoglaucus]
MSLTFALQSLLARHEAYVLEAEEERRKMAASIDQLECDKKEMEAASAKTIEENRNLLDQLEELNNTVSTSDDQVSSLNATLQSTCQELERVNALATRAMQLEAQLSLMETETTGLNDKLLTSQEDCRSVSERWKDAQRTICTLQEQIDRMEAEARDERERHTEVMNRYERRSLVERQLENAAGRLKGAAAATTKGKPGESKKHVVSHFVKDILADNASLQMGIMELREMLTGSNEEVQNLRQQMLLHQEVQSDQHKDNSLVAMDQELNRSSMAEQDAVPALHVHHHYHEASKAGPIRQRSKARRSRRFSRVASGVSTPKSGLQTPNSQNIRSRSPSTAATILSHTAVSIPPPPDYSNPHRLSTHSANRRMSFAPSSQPSSAHPSMFDFVSESSRPTSPADSIDVFSPPLLPVRSKRLNSISSHEPPSPRTVRIRHSDTVGGLHIMDDYLDNPGASPHRTGIDPNTIPESPEQDLTTNPLDRPPTQQDRQKVSLRRSASHESILSISANPSRHSAHPLRTKHSLIFRGSALARNSHASLTPSTPTTTLLSSKPAVLESSSQQQQQQRHPHDERATNRTVSASATLSSSLLLRPPPTNTTATLSKRLGGWTWGKWGIAPSPSPSPSIPSPSTFPTPTTTSNKAERSKGKATRAPGVNQKGSLRALRDAVVGVGEGESHVEAREVDVLALRESLGEG